MICAYCVRPKVNYISNGKVFCSCGGTIDMDTSAAAVAMLNDNRDPRPAIFPPPSPPAPPPATTEKITLNGRVFDNYREARRSTLTRFTRTLGNETFDCAKCKCIRPAATMMRFADNEAMVQTTLTDWCGICVKDEIKSICPTKGDFKRVWGLLKEGVSLPEYMLNSSEYVKPPVVEKTDWTRDPRATDVVPYKQREWRNPVSPRKPEGPPPELDLAF